MSSQTLQLKLCTDGYNSVVTRADGPLCHRADIDGLRAIAVLLIVLFHLRLSPPGGFVGVDVFFVISGFLITTIILRDIEVGRFSFGAFYARRMRRILPALLVMLIVTLGAGAFLLMPGDYGAAGRSALYAAGSLSNVYFFNHTGYFDVSSDLMPLLHTWSLGVEEQFYLVWPALLVMIIAIVGTSRRKVGFVVAALCLTSLAWCLYRMRHDPKAAFYLPQARAWELGVGALIAIVPRSRYPASFAVAAAAGLAGLSLILWSAFSLTSASPFPGINAIVPVAGAALLIAPWPATGPVQRLLSLEPLTFLGRISYSLYLWHWPILVLWRQYQLGAALSTTESAVLAVVILAIAWISWACIEEPVRRAGWAAPRVIKTGLTAASAVALAGLAITIANGFPSRAPGAERYASLDVMWDWNCRHVHDLSESGLPGPYCILGADGSKISALLIGESHAEHMAPLIDVAAGANGISVAFSNSRPACMPLLGSTSVQRYFPQSPDYNRFCADLIKPVLGYIRTHPDLHLVILSSAWTSYPSDLYRNDPSERSERHGLELLAQGFDELFGALDRPDLRVLVIDQLPTLVPYNHSCLSQTGLILRRPCPATMMKTVTTAHEEKVLAVIRDLPKRWPHVSVLLPRDFMCNDVGCPTTLNGEFLYRDTTHLRRNLKADTTQQLVELLHLQDALTHAAMSPEDLPNRWIWTGGPPDQPLVRRRQSFFGLGLGRGVSSGMVSSTSR